MSPTQTLFLAWQDPDGRQWFPIGRLDADGSYRYRYIEGARRAQGAGFEAMRDFPELERDYRSSELFALFRNRVIAAGRPDRHEYLRSLDLPDDADPFTILAANGGRRMTDLYEVFPKLAKNRDGTFTCRFFLHGVSHVPKASQEREACLQADELVQVTLELTNPKTGIAVQIQSSDYHVLGWAPRYLVTDLVAAMAETPTYEARVVRRNAPPVPRSHQLLIEMRGSWSKHEPMRGGDFRPLVP